VRCVGINKLLLVDQFSDRSFRKKERRMGRRNEKSFDVTDTFCFARRNILASRKSHAYLDLVILLLVYSDTVQLFYEAETVSTTSPTNFHDVCPKVRVLHQPDCSFDPKPKYCTSAVARSSRSSRTALARLLVGPGVQLLLKHDFSFEPKLKGPHQPGFSFDPKLMRTAQTRLLV